MCEANEYKKYLHLLNETNYYKILGVNESSSLEVITKEYRLLAKKLHPDVYPNSTPDEKQRISQVFQKITHAFNFLKDAEKKNSYDRELSLQRAKSEVKVVVPEIKKATPNNPSAPVSGIKDDPRIKSGFTFSKFESVDTDKIRADRDAKEKEQAKANFEKARKLIDQKNYDEAVNILRTLTEKYGNNAEYHGYLGLAMQEKGWNGYAQAEFKVALHFDPNNEIALANYKPSGKSPEKTENKTAEQGSMVGRLRSFFNKK